MINSTKEIDSMKILLVDDEKDFLEQSKIFLQEQNKDLQIETTSTPEKALKILSNDKFDCIVSDYQMPEINGLKLLKKIREERNNDIPFIMFTGKGREEVAIKALNLGADRYLQKGGSPKSQFGVLAQAITQETIHKKAKEDLLEREERYRRLFESAQDGMLILDAESGEIKDANPYIQELLGYSKEELIGKELWQIGTFQNIAENMERFEELVEEEFIRYEDMPLKTKGGEEASVEFVSNTYLVGGEKVVQCNIRDITERKKVEEKYRNLFETMAQGVVYQDSEGDIISANPAAERILGLSVDQMKGRTSRHPDWKAIKEDGSPFPGEEHPAMVALRTGEEVRDVVMGVYHPEKEEYVWININAVPQFREDEDEPYQVYTTFEDITKSKRAEKKLKKSRKKYRRLFNSIRDAILVADTDRNIIDCNPAFTDLFGYELEEIEGKKTVYVYHDEEQFKEMGDKIRRSMGDENFYYTIDYEKKSGEVFPGETNAFYLKNKDGEIKGFVGLIKNIKERKRREKELERSKKQYEELSKEFELILDHIPGLIFYKDTENNFIRVNKRLAEAHNMTKQELEEKSLFELYSKEEAQEYWEDDKEVIENEEPKLNIIEPWTTEEETKWMETSKIPYVINGEVKGIIGISMDITERKELEEREKFLHSLLRHDVRNKIQIILGYKELLKDFDLPKKAEEYISKGRKGAEESLEIIEKVSTLREAQEEKIKKVSIENTVQKSIKEARPMAKEKGIKIKAECPKGKCKVLAGDLLDRVFSNIIENSIQHSKGTKIKIHGKENEKNIICIIEDNGRGIPDDKKDKIFDKGYTTDEERGTGLGLFLAKTLINIYEGKIEVKDSELGGARFDVHLQKT